MKNRFKVEMRGNQPVVYDTETFKVIKWFRSVLWQPLARKDAEAFARELNSKNELPVTINQTKTYGT